MAEGLTRGRGPVYVQETFALSALGEGANAHWQAIADGRSGLSPLPDGSVGWAGQIDGKPWRDTRWKPQTELNGLSDFEAMGAFAGRQVLSEGPYGDGYALILATTKGSIEWLGKVPDERIALHRSAALIAEAIGGKCTSVSVVSHACVSGVTALLMGARMIQAGRAKDVVVIGADRLSPFVVSGFRSFQALAPGRCRPFDAQRQGINLGEAAAAIRLSSRPNPYVDEILLCGGGTSNDANHISGPSRTGAELAQAIGLAMREAEVGPQDIGAISAHGTATLYNDEMEAKAFASAGLLHAEVHSLKGYVGHTLGAAGVLESIMAIESLRRQECIPSLGFSELGVSEAVNITREPKPLKTEYVLKTASGFGGCNAAVVWGRGALTHRQSR